jgi:hypothetical protein
MVSMSNQGGNPNRPEQLDEVYPVAPPDPESGEHEPKGTPSVHPPVSPVLAEVEPPEEGRFQFTLAEMLLAVPVASLFLSILGLLPGGYTAANFAGLTGGGVLLSLLVLTLLRPTRPIIELCWWAMLVVYAVACVVAIVRG